MFIYIFVSTLEFMLIGLISLINYKQLQLMSLITTKLNDISDNIPVIDIESESEENEIESENESENESEDESEDEKKEETENDKSKYEDVQGNLDISDVDILKHIFQQNNDYGNVINSLSQMLEESSKKNKIS